MNGCAVFVGRDTKKQEEFEKYSYSVTIFSKNFLTDSISITIISKLLKQLIDI